MREVLNAIFYLNRSGCQWDMLPHDLPAKSTVYDYFAQWRDDGTWQRILDALRRRGADRRRPGAEPQCRQHRQPDGQGDRGRRRAGLRRGQEDHAGGSGTSSWTRWGCCWSSWSRRPRPTTGRSPPRCCGRLTAEHRTPAGAGVGRQQVPQPPPVRLAGGVRRGYRIEVIGRPAGSVGFVKLPRRWVVERTFAWLGRYRRNSRDYERYTHSSEAMLGVSSIHRMLRLLSTRSDEDQPRPSNTEKNREKLPDSL